MTLSFPQHNYPARSPSSFDPKHAFDSPSFLPSKIRSLTQVHNIKSNKMASRTVFRRVPSNVEDWRMYCKDAGIQGRSINSFLGMHGRASHGDTLHGHAPHRRAS